MGITLFQDRLISTFLSMNTKISTIAKRTGRHRSTIYRELKRNKSGQRYMPGLAHELAAERHPHRPNKIDTQSSLNKFVLDGLSKGWSPEQISGRLKKEEKEISICHESIYRYVYRDQKRELYKFLPRQKLKRHPGANRKSYQKERLLRRNISNRPEEAKLREVLGHWEGDIIRFPRGQKACVTTLVERKTRYLLLHKNENAKSEPVIKKICETIKSSPKKLWCSLTFDQGGEFMFFPFIERQTKCKIFFCDPHSPWQRPSNENTNGRVRRFLSKKFNIDMTSQEEIDRIERQINGTPRKCLGYQTPKEALIQHFGDFCRTGL